MPQTMTCSQPDCEEQVTYDGADENPNTIAARPHPGGVRTVEVFLQCSRGHVNKYTVNGT